MPSSTLTTTQPEKNSPAQTLYLIDGHAQIFRAYFAIRGGGMTSPVTGEPTHAVFAFAATLLKFFAEFRPRYALMAIDTPGKTFRDELYDQYKAHRPPPPDDFFSQEQRIFELTRMFGVPILGQTGAEADDVIATVVRRILHDPRYNDFHIRIVSRDKDLEQLLSDRVTLFDIHTDTTIDAHWLMENKGIRPDQVVDMLALMGDSVDNVPGVEGVGPKTASQLIHEFGSISNLLANLDKIKGKRRENIEKARGLLALSRKLVALKADLDIPFDLDLCRLGPIDSAGVKHMFELLGFRRHQTELEKLIATTDASTPSANIQLTSPAPSTPTKSPSTKSPQSELGFASNLFESSISPPPQPHDAQADQQSPSNPTSTKSFNLGAVSGDPLNLANLSTSAGRDYHAITTQPQLNDLADTLREQTLFAVDTETVGLGHRAALCGLSIAWKTNHAVYIPILSPNPSEHLDAPTIFAALQPLFLDERIAKCGHNLKYDLLVLRNAGLELRGVVFDSMIASHLLGSPGHGLDHLALALLKHHMMQISQLIGPAPSRGTSQKTMDQVPLDLITRYAADDAEVSLRLYLAMHPQIKSLGLDDLASRVEMPLVEVLAEMEWVGIRVDPDVLIEQKKNLAGRIDELRALIHQHAGSQFNIDSPRQLADVLFNKLKLPIIKKTKTGPSTDVEVLEKLAELENLTPQQAQVPRLLVEYRQITKLVSTYLDAIRESIDPQTGRVHAHFHQTGAATGRLSSSEPNLQNIPIRTPVGRQIRKAFVAEPGSVLISADYSQIELRILAHLSSDPNLLRAFELDQDIHAAVAAQVFSVPPDAVTPDQRGQAKTINFGIIYGVTPYGLARQIEGWDSKRAAQLIADYKNKFTGIDAFLGLCVKQAQDLGYVTTILGRRRPIPQIKSTNAAQHNLGRRLAINSVVQGSAADLIKLAMVNLHRRTIREKLPLKLLLQIHDELVLEAPQDRAEELTNLVRHEMETAMSLRVPLKVETGTGADWLACK